MGVVTRLLRPSERRDSTLRNPERALIEALRGGIGTSAGVVVSDEGALAYSAVLACVRVLSESVATLPCILYERMEQDGQAGKRRAADHALYRVLHTAPNPEMTSFEFWEMAIVHLLLWGNFYAEIVVDGRGDVAALWPIPPKLVTPVRQPDKRLVYEVELPEKKKTFGAEWIFHVAGMRTTGLKGLSVVGHAREAIGLGMAAEQYGASVFGNGMVPGGVLEHPGELSDEAYARLLSSWRERHEGLSNAQRLAILEDGMKYNKIGIPPEDAQFLETRRFQRSEIAGMFRVPLHMIGDLERATFSNIEHQSTEYVVYSVQPWLRRIEARAQVSLLLRPEQERYFAEFLVDGLLRGDAVSRNQAYSTARQWGWMSANDIRRLENMDTVAGGDVYLVPLNMVTAGARARSGQGDGQDGRYGRGDGRTRTDTDAPRTPSTRSDQQLARARQRIAEIARPQLAEAAQRVLNREFNDIGAAAKSLLGKRGRAEFDEWLNQFATDHAAFVEKQMRGPVTAAGALAADSAADEINADAAPDLTEFTDDYLSDRAARWIAILRAALQEAVYPPTEPTGYDPLAAVQTVLQQRKDEAADDWARDQAIRIVNAFAVVAWTVLGWLALRWVAFGKNCDFCGHLNGRTVGISSWFAQAGESIPGADGQTPLKPGSNVRHPPLHNGCDCMVVPG
jgi:HK97 family phage portal protein